MKSKFFLSKIFSTLFFTGYTPKASGTVGTLITMVLIFPFFQNLSIFDLQYLVFAVFFLGTISTHIYIIHTRRDDPKEVVIDEAFGVLLCLAICKFFSQDVSTVKLFIVSFIAFRFFDIVKPFPISYIDKNLKNAFGVMLDDGIAGIFASIVVIIVIKILL
jgi:phosphatidylglycerophosphatase A